MEKYLPEDALNMMEKIYHPLTFRTQLCKYKCCKYDARCKTSYICAFAHHNEDLRGMSENQYLQLFDQPQDRPAKSLKDFLLPRPASSIPQITYGWSTQQGK